MTNMVARLHVLGQPIDKDPVILGRDATATWKLAPEEWPWVWQPRGSQWLVVGAGGARPEFRVGVAKLSQLDASGASKTPWRIVADYGDGIEDTQVRGDRLYLLSTKDAPNRRVLSVPLGKPELAKARVEIPEDPDATLVGIYGARDALYMLHRVNGLARVSRWPWRGKPEALSLPYEGWAHDFTYASDRDGITFQIETWLRTGTYFTYDPKTKKLSPHGLASTSTLDVSKLAAVEVEATSADGTKVPLSILSRADRQVGAPQPAIVYGYAAYGVSETPGFSASRLAWVERGGVYAICHGRGGGERGRKWQDGGSRENKLKGVQDFLACAQYLVDNGYTTKGKLAGIGYSMGGVLAGRAMTLQPELFAAVWLGAPIVNPLRILAAENGANQKGELGDPTTEAGYRSIAAMDPYATAKPGVAYPAVIFTVGLNDHRVAPWMASKLASRLLAGTTSKRPILVRVDGAAGHGIGNTRDQVFAERADIYSFFLAQFGEAEFVAR
jgi:prolyl oligopeptidase